MLIFILKKKWYEKIRIGEKRIEYREVKPYWTKRIESVTHGKYHLRDYGAGITVVTLQTQSANCG